MGLHVEQPNWGDGRCSTFVNFHDFSAACALLAQILEGLYYNHRPLVLSFCFLLLVHARLASLAARTGTQKSKRMTCTQSTEMRCGDELSVRS